MPALFAASIKFVPRGASTTLLSIMSLTVSAMFLASLLKLTAVLRHECFDWPRGGFTERANRFAVDVVGHVPEQVHIFRAPVTGVHAMEHLLHPERPLPARCALAAGLVGEKLRDVQRALRSEEHTSELQSRFGIS